MDRDCITRARYGESFALRLVDFYFIHLVQYLRRDGKIGHDVYRALIRCHTKKYTKPSVAEIFQGRGDPEVNRLLQALLTKFATQFPLYILTVNNDTPTACVALEEFVKNGLPADMVASQLVGTERINTHLIVCTKFNGTKFTFANTWEGEPFVTITKESMLQGKSFRMNNAKYVTDYCSYFSPIDAPLEEGQLKAFLDNPSQEALAVIAELKEIVARINATEDVQPAHCPSDAAPLTGFDPRRMIILSREEGRPLEPRPLNTATRYTPLPSSSSSDEREPPTHCHGKPHCAPEKSHPGIRRVIDLILTNLSEASEDSIASCHKLIDAVEAKVGHPLSAEDWWYLAGTNFEHLRYGYDKSQPSLSTLRHLANWHDRKKLAFAVEKATEMYMDPIVLLNRVTDALVKKMRIRIKQILEEEPEYEGSEAFLRSYDEVFENRKGYFLLRILTFLGHPDEEPELIVREAKNHIRGRVLDALTDREGGSRRVRRKRTCAMKEGGSRRVRRKRTRAI
jgi:hypothetical protein